MKLYVTILQVIALLALTGTTLGDDVAKVTSPRICTVKADEYKSMSVILSRLAIGCVVSNGLSIEQLGETKSFEDRRAFFKNICDKSHQIRECLTGVEQQSEVCQDQAHHNISKIFNHLLETTLDSGCAMDGVPIASMTTLFINSSSGPFNNDPFHNCVTTGLGKVGMLAGEDIELSSRFFIMYREAINVKGCFGEITEGDQNLLNTASNITSIIGDIARKMKCIHPQDGTLVRCATIDVTLPDTPRLCPIKSVDEKRSPVNDLLVNRLSWCLQSSFYQEDEGWDTIENLDMSRAFMKTSCNRRRDIRHCSSDVVTFSLVCLNETQHNTIKIAEDSLQNVLDYGCLEDGQYLAYVVYKVVSDMKTTPGQNFIKECLAIAKQGHEEVGEQLDAAKVLIYHQQLRVFKECFINKLRGDNRAVFNAETFLMIVQRNMKCLDPVHGKIVLCETIDPTPSTGVKVCPFVSENEDEPPQHEMFVDLGFKCIKASTLDFARTDDLTTLEEFHTFFNSFCRHSLPVKQCIDQLAANSAVCQNQTNHQILNIFTDFLETMLETGCRQDGEALATIAHGFISHAESDVDTARLELCWDTARQQFKNVGLNSDTLPAKRMLVYRTFESLKECFVNADYEVGSFKNVFVTFMNDILRSFKCIHPDDGTTVLCETIINN